MTNQQEKNWNYDFDDSQAGPSNWINLFGGEFKRQSPIDIVTNFDHEHNRRSQLTCCRGMLVNSGHDDVDETTTPQDRLANHFETNLRLNQNQQQNQHRIHRDSVGDDTRGRTPDSGLRSGSESSLGHLSPQPDADDDGYDSQQQKTKRANNHNDQQQHHQHHHNHHHHQQSHDHQMSSATTIQKHHQQHSPKCKAPMNNNNNEQETRFCTTKRKLFLGYPRYLSNVKLENNGHAWQVNIPSRLAEHTLFCGPPFADRQYRLAQFHCHWGSDCNSGSEHTINGQAYSAEIHFVHWNCTDFKSFEEASRHGNGLAVLGVLVQAIEGEQNRNRHLDRIVNQLQKVRKSKSSADVALGLDMKRLFPKNRWRYATYDGSLTTPPLSEVVHWLVFLTPIQCSTTQIEEFRRIECSDFKQLTQNCRSIQPTNGRLVSIWSHH